jgi:hypothetical protein
MTQFIALKGFSELEAETLEIVKRGVTQEDLAQAQTLFDGVEKEYQDVRLKNETVLRDNKLMILQAVKTNTLDDLELKPLSTEFTDIDNLREMRFRILNYLKEVFDNANS